MQKAMDELEQLSAAIAIPISAIKTKAILFSKKKSTDLPKITLNGTEIHYEINPKLLGAVLDPKLSWTSHIEAMKHSCISRVVILKRLASSPWASSPKSLLDFFKRYIRPRIEFHPEVTLSSNKSSLAKLETIQNACIRIALGLHKHTPNNKLRRVAGLQTIEERSTMLMAKYFTKVQAYGNEHPIYKITFGLKNGGEENLISSWDAFRQRATDWERQIQAAPLFPPSPPWTWHPVDVSIRMIDYKKEHYPPVQIKSILSEMAKTMYPAHLQIYTDGSVKSDKAASAAVIPAYHLKLSKRLPDQASVLTSEIEAINEALKVIKAIPPQSGKAVVFSDSKSALLLVKQLSRKAKDTDLAQMRLTITDIRNKGTEVCFQHIPSHQGIRHNEEADAMAGLATDNPSINPPPEVQTYRDILRQRLGNLQPPTTNANLQMFKTRDENCIYLRVKTNAVITRKTEFDWGRRQDPLCRLCQNAQETLQHLLFECNRPCPKLRLLRSEVLKQNLPHDIEEISSIPLQPRRERAVFLPIITALKFLCIS